MTTITASIIIGCCIYYGLKNIAYAINSKFEDLKEKK